jgi:hypothetical protein
VCSLPGAPAASRLGARDIEVGLGAHGEPGFETRPWQPIEQLVPSMLQRILDYGCGGAGCACGAAGAPRGGAAAPGAAGAHVQLNSGAPLALLVNNLGATSMMEMLAVVREALGWARAQGVSLGQGGMAERQGRGGLACLATFPGVAPSVPRCAARRSLSPRPSAATRVPAPLPAPHRARARGPHPHVPRHGGRQPHPHGLR